MNKRPVQPIEIPDDIAVPKPLFDTDPVTENMHAPNTNQATHPKTKKSKPQKSKNESKPGSKSLAVMIFHHTITVFILLLFLAIGTWSYLTFSKSSFFVPGNAAATPPAAQAYIIQAQLQRITATLETYEAIHERFPARLEELVDSGLLLPSDLYYPLVNKSYHYVRYQQSYELNIIDNIQPEFELISDESDDASSL